MKVIFLDFDGVLNSLRSCIAFHGYPFPESDTWDKFDLVAIGLMKKLCKETGAKIVLSTSWRLCMSVEDVKDMFHELGWIEPPIIGRTPSWGNPKTYSTGYMGETFRQTRGDEINVWLKAYGRGDIAPALCDAEILGQKIDAYVIVDDDHDMLKEQEPFFVQTSFLDGLTLANFISMLKILDPNNKELKDISRSIVNDRPVHGIVEIG